MLTELVMLRVLTIVPSNGASRRTGCPGSREAFRAVCLPPRSVALNRFP